MPMWVINVMANGAPIHRGDRSGIFMANTGYYPIFWGWAGVFTGVNTIVTADTTLKTDPTMVPIIAMAPRALSPAESIRTFFNVGRQKQGDHSQVLPIKSINGLEGLAPYQEDEVSLEGNRHAVG